VRVFLEWGLVVVVVGSVLAFGGVQPLAYSLMAIAIYALVFVLVIYQARYGRLALPIPVWVLPLILLVVVQAVPLPPSLRAMLSPAEASFWARGGGSGQTEWITLSIYPHQTIIALCRLLAYVGAFSVAAYVFDSRQKSSVIRTLVLLGCFEAAYGIVQYLAGFQKIFWYTKVYYIQEATGTYINRNHFAGFLEMVIPLGLARVFHLLYSQGGGAMRSGHSRASLLGSPVLLHGFAVVIMLVAIVFSRSRMGMFSICASLVFVALIGQLRARSRVWALGTLLVVLSSIIYALWIGLGPVLDRYELLGQRGYFESEGRLALWRDVWRLVRDYPLAGIGLGTFATGFQRYQTTHVGSLVDHAHSDYLEFAAELGLVGAALVFVPILFLWLRMCWVFVTNPNPHRRAVLLGCIGSTLAILIHGVTDFNLQIPANALVFAVILGIGYKTACLEPRLVATERDTRA